jgi:hypothetical protein
LQARETAAVPPAGAAIPAPHLALASITRPTNATEDATQRSTLAVVTPRRRRSSRRGRIVTQAPTAPGASIVPAIAASRPA